MSENTPQDEPLVKVLWPYLATTAMLTAAVVLLLVRFVLPMGSSVLPRVVTFDTVKYTNSTRAVASTFLGKDGAVGDAGATLHNLPDRVRGSIQKIAGDGALVMLKQAVVQGQEDDITDKVLADLGLPTDVPTMDASAYALDVAPTNFGLSGVQPRKVRNTAMPSGGPALP